VQQLAPFADAEAVVMALLASLGTTVSTTPAQITSPIIRVERVGGADDLVTDYPRIDVSVLYPIAQDGDTAAAWTLAELCRQTMLAARNTTVSGALIDNCENATPPQLLPWDDPNLRLISATYQLALRRPRT
jgi:hypothetical protein